MNRLRILVLLLALPIAFYGQARKKQKAPKAHDHGVASINIVVDGKNVAIEFEAPAEGIIGFEHAARTPAQKKQQQAGLDTLRRRIGEIVRFGPAAGCTITPRKVEVIQEQGEDHSEVKADFAATCTGTLAGAPIHFGLTRVFPKMHDLRVQLLNGTQQDGITVEHDRGSLTLAK